MNWISRLLNKEVLPERRFWLSIQNGKADYYVRHSAFGEREMVLVFNTKEQAEHFIANWDSRTMTDYKQACLKDNYTFWVILQVPNGYYADDIKMSK